MMSLLPLAAAMAAFLASHAIPASPRLRRRMIDGLGERPYLAAYSLLSLAMLRLLAWAYHTAPVVPLWTQPPWLRWLAVAVMPVACLLVVAGATTPNPFSVGPGGRGYDPAHPGILRLTRHPLVWGLALWAGIHTLLNGDAASLLLFGPLLLLALLGPAMLDRKRRRELGPAWPALTAATSRPATLRPGEIGWPRLGAGLALYALLLWAHPHVIGVSPLP